MIAPVVQRTLPRRGNLPLRDEIWLKQVAAEVNADSEMQVIGGNFDIALSLTFGERRFTLVIREGRIVDVRHGKKIDWRCDLGFRASDVTWNRFFQSPPPPLYNSIFAMILRVDDFHLEGDTLVLAQHARAITRLMEILQQKGQSQ